ncbi:hypothetical protein BDU57DRAFT_49047 [Ampelomyces quisqualis]|uniref:Protection of telomeres protein 1 n=1 Tax=Ampelomyces quisqualis TaxID=50730 RepID=A0A6A5R364_AMPQU|nr:hypothetical protein BDU57DRAFT_49047 [Ampelomyces quisqualis]
MPPNGITAINDAKVGGSIVSLLGVVVSLLPPKKTRGTDWVLELAIQDDFTTGAVGSDATIKCRLFRPGPDKFPKNINVGDVALLRDFKLNEWNLRVDAVWTMHSGALIFPASGIPIPALSQAYQVGTQNLQYSATFGTKDPTAQEQMAVIRLKQDASGSVQQVKQYAATQSVAAPARDKLALIKDMVFDRFYDVRVQVVNIYYTTFGTVDLKVTDYTENNLLFRYVDPDDEDYSYQKMEWKGPYGQYTINVLLYGNNATWARDNAAVGEYLFLKNMHAKMSPANKLEGVLHDDRQRPNQIDIRKLMKGSDIDEIVQRRKAYENSRKKKSAFEELQSAPNNPLAKSSKSKKAEKKARQRLHKEQEQREIAEQAEEWEAKRSGNNLNIKAAHPEAKPSTISEIVFNPHLNAQTPRYNEFKLPFINSRHRARVRVVDFFPPEIELFAHASNDPAWDKRAKKKDLNNSTTKTRWEWGFILLVEDAKLPPDTVSEKLRLMVGNDGAQYLLGMDAQNLKTNIQLRTKLEEKLFILWGNLLELKTELRMIGSDMPLPTGDNRLINKPFDACIEEYGHEVRVTEDNPSGYLRLHRLAETRIMG